MLSTVKYTMLYIQHKPCKEYNVSWSTLADWLPWGGREITMSRSLARTDFWVQQKEAGMNMQMTNTYVWVKKYLGSYHMSKVQGSGRL